MKEPLRWAGNETFISLLPRWACCVLHSSGLQATNSTPLPPAACRELRHPSSMPQCQDGPACRAWGGHGGLQAASGPGRGVARPLPPPTAQQHCEGHVDAAALPLIAAKEKSMVGAGIFQPDAACWRLGTAWARCQAHWTEQRAQQAKMNPNESKMERQRYTPGQY